MESKKMLSDLFMHMQWADETVWQKVLVSQEAVEDRKIKELFFHIHLVQKAFLGVWENTEWKNTVIEDFAELGDVYKWSLDFYQKVNSPNFEVFERDLKVNVDIPWSVWAEQKMNVKIVPATLSDTILQTAMHTAYHRAQINYRLRELGVEPPIVDFIMWAWLGKPAVKQGE